MQICPSQGHLVRLAELLPDAKILGPIDATVTGCTCDSRRVRDGELFVALAGHRRDGHDFIAEAVERGCAAVLSERDPPDALYPSVPWCIVPDARDAYGRICHFLAGNPCRQLKLIGVTGRNGKTTTSCLIAGVLSAAGCRVGVLGKLGCLDGRAVEPVFETAPSAEHLAGLLARMVANDCSHAVMEVSDQALIRSSTAGAAFDIACMTNAAWNPSPNSQANRRISRAVKSDLFEHLSEDGLAVLNADDPGSAVYLRRLDCPVLTVGIDAAAEITATPLEQCPSEQTFLLTAGSEIVPVRTQMIGRHHIYNCLTAAAVGLAYGIDLTAIARGLESVGHVPGRLERIERGQPFSVFLEDARTTEAVRAALGVLQPVTAGRLIYVFESVVSVFGDSSLHQAEAMKIIPDRREAIERALETARPGDSVLIVGRRDEDHPILIETLEQIAQRTDQ